MNGIPLDIFTMFVNEGRLFQRDDGSIITIRPKVINGYVHKIYIPIKGDAKYWVVKL